MLLRAEDEVLAWHLLRSKPRQERVAVATLEQGGYEVYCPLILGPAPVSGKDRLEPLFPGYVFARLVALQDFQNITYSRGLGGFVRFGDRFAALEDEMICGLRAAEKGRGWVVPRELRAPIGAGARVEVIRGPLRGLEGVVERVLPRRERVRLLLVAVTGGTWRAEARLADVRERPKSVSRGGGRRP